MRGRLFELLRNQEPELERFLAFPRTSCRKRSKGRPLRFLLICGAGPQLSIGPRATFARGLFPREKEVSWRDNWDCGGDNS